MENWSERTLQSHLQLSANLRTQWSRMDRVKKAEILEEGVWAIVEKGKVYI